VAIPHVPANVEAEQALLGALLYDNAAFERIGDYLQARHFFEPFHQRLFAAIESHIRKGQLAEPILLAEQFSATRPSRSSAASATSPTWWTAPRRRQRTLTMRARSTTWRCGAT
jgi:replicative DNA helicase